MKELKPRKERLKLILGCMRGGKTTELARVLSVESVIRKTLVVNHSLDTRYNTDGISTHSGIHKEGVMVSNLNSLLTMEKYIESEVIGIDEGALFGEELYEFITSQLKTTKKSFVIASLVGDTNKNNFGSVHKLLPHADWGIEFFHAICTRCKDGTPACFNISNTTEQIVIGVDIYESVCREHYDEHVSNITKQ